jgi:hypothetical protein
MEFRWLTQEEQRTRVVETGSLAEVLALAQQLQAEGEAQFSEEQVVEMGRELGVQPQYIREALRLRRRTAQPPRSLPTESEPVRIGDAPATSLARALAVGVGLGTLPMALIALAHSNAEPVTFFVLIATLVAGWSARHPRLAGVAGAVTAPIIVLASAIFMGAHQMPGLEAEAFFFSLLSFTPLGAATARLAARLHSRLERLTDAPRLKASSH